MTRVVTSTTLAQAVADHLRKSIHRGELGPGEKLPAERDLAARLGVARISLREALKQLRADGYIDVRRGASGGTFVTGLQRPAEAWQARMRTQVGEIDDIIELRIALETEIAALAAQRHTVSDLQTMEESIVALATGRTPFRHADSTFHLGLAAAAHNERLRSAVETARGELFSPHDVLPFDEPVRENLRDHQLILDAVRARDAEAASRAVRGHLHNARRQLRFIVFGGPEEPRDGT